MKQTIKILSPTGTIDIPGTYRLNICIIESAHRTWRYFYGTNLRLKRRLHHAVSHFNRALVPLRLCLSGVSAVIHLLLIGVYLLFPVFYPDREARRVAPMAPVCDIMIQFFLFIINSFLAH